MGESGNISHKWDCKISDSYADIMGSSYNCMEYPDAPEIEISVSGKKGDNSKITKSELEKNGFQFFNDKDNGFGYTANRLLVSQYMNKNNIYSIDIGFNIKFPPESTSMYGGIFYSGTSTVIHRNAFALESVNFSSNYYHAGTDNYFYNNSGDKKISVTANIKTTGSSSDYGSGALKDSTLYFDKAYLKAGDNTVINAADSSGKPISSVKVDGGKSFKLEFPYTEGLDSQNAGVVLMFENARLRYTPVYRRRRGAQNVGRKLQHSGIFQQVNRRLPYVDSQNRLAKPDRCSISGRRYRFEQMEQNGYVIRRAE